MAKVLGVILTIIGGLAVLGNVFVYLNSSAHLSYNPADAPKGLLDVDLMLPFVLFGGMLLAGILLLKYSTEPELK
jgi:hypothetical protein